jgi:sugar phosphate isomerase/epimerase
VPPLGYSTNLHAAETVADLLAEVVPAAADIRDRLGWPALGLDLRLGFAALAGGDWAALRRACDRHRLSAHTLNGFPLEPFQAAVVKDAAYRPDWHDPRRLSASRDLCTAALALSDEPVVTISTVPGSFRPWGGTRPAAIAAAIGCWVAHAARIRRATGRTVVLALEPEPWCLLETSADVAWFWRGPLATAGLQAATAGLDGDAAAAAQALGDHLGVCFDTCHIAIAGEDPATAARTMAAAGARIVKCQVSACPEVRDPHRDPAGVAALRAMAEPRFLHQTTALATSGSAARALDLDGLDDCLARLPQAAVVRSHFHVPLTSVEQAAGLSATVAAARSGLAAARAQGCRHIAVETYTWPLLAADQRDIRAGTAGELRILAEWLAVVDQPAVPVPTAPP